MNRALVSNDRGDPQQAKELLAQAIALQKQVLRDSPNDPTAADLLFKHYWDLGEACISAGRPAAAAKTAEMLVTAFPKRLDAYQQAVTLLLDAARLTDQADSRAGGAAKAEARSSKEKDADAPSVSAWPATADDYRRRADDLMTDARNVSDNNPDTTVGFARFLLLCNDESVRDPSWALVLAESVVRDYPERSRAWFTLALAHYRTGDWQAADDAEQKSIKLSYGESADHSNVYDWLLLSMIRFRQGRIDEARELRKKGDAWITEHKTKDEDLRRLSADANEVFDSVNRNSLSPTNTDQQSR
jgi:tetratricopeptide (TPR) repeat protein